LIGAEGEGGEEIGDALEGGEDDDGYVGALAEPAADGETIHVRHHDVEDDEMGLKPDERGQAFLTGLGGMDLVAAGGQVLAQEMQEIGIIVNDENSSVGRHVTVLRAQSVLDLCTNSAHSVVSQFTIRRQGTVGESRATRDDTRERESRPHDSMRKSDWGSSFVKKS
jgi:hypothetical protein